MNQPVNYDPPVFYRPKGSPRSAARQQFAKLFSDTPPRPPQTSASILRAKIEQARKAATQ